MISAGDAKKAADYEIPRARVLVADVWKKMEVEIEWGFDTAAADKDYSGRIETYDGVLAGLRRSIATAVPRRRMRIRGARSGKASPVEV